MVAFYGNKKAIIIWQFCVVTAGYIAWQLCVVVEGFESCGNYVWYQKDFNSVVALCGKEGLIQYSSSVW